MDIRELKKWFLSQRRELPWREHPDPYAVWVSEVMLQQTQVSVVIPYFERWMARFPTISELAKAPLEAVLKEWEGLGYYARARHLHEGAKTVAERYGGVLPSSAEQLKEIKGLGAYTIGAILSFAFHQRAAAVDGNVVRVLARYYCLSDDIAKAKTVKKFQALAQDLLPQEEPWIVGEALIELGATVCSRVPKCGECPLRKSCRAFASGKSGALPVKSTKIKTTRLFRLVAVVLSRGHLLIRKGEKGKVMGDLCEFPYVEVESAALDRKDYVQKELNLAAEWQHALPRVEHSFTRYQALLQPHMFITGERQPVKGCDWRSIQELQKMPFSSGHRRIFEDLRRFYINCNQDH